MNTTVTTTAATTTARHICLGCGGKFATAAKLTVHQADCKRFRLECKLIEAQDKIKV